RGDKVVPFHLGKVKLAPGVMVLPPPEHPSIVLQNQVIATTIRVLSKEAGYRDFFPVLQHKNQIIATAFKSGNAFWRNLQDDDRRTIKVYQLTISARLAYLTTRLVNRFHIKFLSSSKIKRQGSICF